MKSLQDLLLDENVLSFFASTFAESSISLEGIATFVIQSREPLRFALNATTNGIGFCRGIGGLTDAAPLSLSAMGFQIGFRYIFLSMGFWVKNFKRRFKIISHTSGFIQNVDDLKVHRNAKKSASRCAMPSGTANASRCTISSCLNNDK